MSGTSVAWYYAIASDASTTSSSATFTLDDGAPQTIAIPGRGASQTSNWYNQFLYQSEDYPMGSHTLTVTYEGDASSSPLTLQYLVVQNGTALSSTSSSSTSAQSGTTPVHSSASTSAPSLPSASSQNSTKTPLAAIIGGTLGGIIFLLVVAFLFVFLRRRKKSTPYDSVPQPAFYSTEPQHPQTIYSIPVAGTLQAPFNPPKEVIGSSSETFYPSSSNSDLQSTVQGGSEHQYTYQDRKVRLAPVTPDSHNSSQEVLASQSVSYPSKTQEPAPPQYSLQ